MYHVIYLHLLSPNVFIDDHKTAINGAVFKTHFGSLGDYAYTSTGVLPLTIFTGCCFEPQAMQLAKVWNSHRSALIHTLQKVS